MGAKKSGSTRKAVEDPELKELAARKVTTESECRDAFRDAAVLQFEASKLRAKAAPAELKLAEQYKTPADHLLAKSAVLLEKVMAFALKNRKKLKLDGQRWAITSFGFVQFRTGNPAVTFADDVTGDEVIKRLRSKAAALKKLHSVDVETLIETKEVLKLDDLRAAIPEELREEFGFSITRKVSAQPVIDFGKVPLETTPAARRAR